MMFDEGHALLQDLPVLLPEITDASLLRQC